MLVIEPGRAGRNYWGDLWRYRELMYFLVWRDILVRYKQTAIGIAWAVLRPALTMVAFVMFRHLAGMPASSVPEPVLVFAAVLPWQLFSSGLTEASGSLIGNSNLISKVYFPRIIVPLATVLTVLVDFLISLTILALLMAWYGIWPSRQVLALPFFVLQAMALSLGLGLLFAGLNVKYRDFRYVVPFIVQFGIFVSPIAFTTANLPEHWRPWLALNPLVGIIDGFRWSLLGEAFSLDLFSVGVSLLATALFLTLGTAYFRRTERGFADVI